MELRALSLPRNLAGTFITSARSSPSSSRESQVAVQSLHPSPRLSIAQVMDSCSHLQHQLHSDHHSIPFTRSRSQTRLSESSHRPGRWRSTDTYTSQRDAILKAQDRRKIAQSDQEIAVVKQFLDSKSTLKAPKVKVTAADLQNPRVRRLLSLNKRDFGSQFNLSQVKISEKASKSPFRIPPSPDEDDLIALKREISRFQQETLYKISPNFAESSKMPSRRSSWRAKVAVEMEKLGPLSRFIVKEGGKYNAAWCNEARRYRQRRLHDAYLKSLGPLNR